MDALTAVRAFAAQHALPSDGAVVLKDGSLVTSMRASMSPTLRLASRMNGSAERRSMLGNGRRTSNPAPSRCLCAVLMLRSELQPDGSSKLVARLTGWTLADVEDDGVARPDLRVAGEDIDIRVSALPVTVPSTRQATRSSALRAKRPSTLIV